MAISGTNITTTINIMQTINYLSNFIKETNSSHFQYIHYLNPFNWNYFHYYSY